MEDKKLKIAPFLTASNAFSMEAWDSLITKRPDMKRIEVEHPEHPDVDYFLDATEQLYQVHFRQPSDGGILSAGIRPTMVNVVPLSHKEATRIREKKK